MPIHLGARIEKNEPKGDKGRIEGQTTETLAMQCSRAELGVVYVDKMDSDRSEAND